MPNTMTVELPEMPPGPSVQGGRDPGLLVPLRGITILAVEDSRFASEALRLMCRRLGVRLRRAETIHAARSHLKLYRPTLVIVDLGLPDGRGETLIREIVMTGASAPVVLGSSADPTGRLSALAAGAEGFLDKPLESFAAFHAVLMRHLPEHIMAVADPDAPLAPDHLALRDDFAHAAALIEAGLAAGPDADSQVYLSRFVTGVARHAHDTVLAEAAEQAATSPLATRFDHMRYLLQHRLATPPDAFGGKVTHPENAQVTGPG